MAARRGLQAGMLSRADVGDDSPFLPQLRLNSSVSHNDLQRGESVRAAKHAILNKVRLALATRDWSAVSAALPILLQEMRSQPRNVFESIIQALESFTAQLEQIADASDDAVQSANDMKTRLLRLFRLAIEADRDVLAKADGMIASRLDQIASGVSFDLSPVPTGLDGDVDGGWAAVHLARTIAAQPHVRGAKGEDIGRVKKLRQAQAHALARVRAFTAQWIETLLERRMWSEALTAAEDALTSAMAGAGAGGGHGRKGRGHRAGAVQEGNEEDEDGAQAIQSKGKGKKCKRNAAGASVSAQQAASSGAGQGHNDIEDDDDDDDDDAGTVDAMAALLGIGPKPSAGAGASSKAVSSGPANKKAKMAPAPAPAPAAAPRAVSSSASAPASASGYRDEEDDEESEDDDRPSGAGASSAGAVSSSARVVNRDVDDDDEDEVEPEDRSAGAGAGGGQAQVSSASSVPARPSRSSRSSALAARSFMHDMLAPGAAAAARRAAARTDGGTDGGRTRGSAKATSSSAAHDQPVVGAWRPDEPDDDEDGGPEARAGSLGLWHLRMHALAGAAAFGQARVSGAGASAAGANSSNNLLATAEKHLIIAVRGILSRIRAFDVAIGAAGGQHSAGAATVPSAGGPAAVGAAGSRSNAAIQVSVPAGYGSAPTPPAQASVLMTGLARRGALLTAVLGTAHLSEAGQALADVFKALGRTTEAGMVVREWTQALL